MESKFAGRFSSPKSFIRCFLLRHHARALTTLIVSSLFLEMGLDARDVYTFFSCSLTEVAGQMQLFTVGRLLYEDTTDTGETGSLLVLFQIVDARSKGVVR